MTSKLQHATEAYVWMWLPETLEPLVIGKMVLEAGRYHFTYGRHYRAHKKGIALSPVELPMAAHTFSPTGLHEMWPSLRDSSPDAWGRRLIDYQFPDLNPNELDYLLLSGSDRIGALDFQSSATEYKPRESAPVPLRAVEDLAKMLEEQQPMNKKLLPIILHGTSVGGARPKCLIEIGKKSYLAKFSLSGDRHAFVKMEYAAMKLAEKIGLKVAPVLLTSIGERDVLLVERFDRELTTKGLYRKHILSALSLLNLHEMEARYASYRNFADLIRQRFDKPKETLHELFKRLVFNILIGNTDDHARNHAAFWDGRSLHLTPAYDLSPQLRVGYEASQAMMIEGMQGNASTLVNVLSTHAAFLLTKSAAKEIIEQQIEVLDTHWESLCVEAGLSLPERSRLWGSVIKSEYCLQGWVV